MMKHTLKCWLWKLLWLAGAVAFVLGVASVLRGALVLGLDPLGWYWNALVLAALSIPIKLDCVDCGACAGQTQ